MTACRAIRANAVSIRQNASPTVKTVTSRCDIAGKLLCIAAAVYASDAVLIVDISRLGRRRCQRQVLVQLRSVAIAARECFQTTRSITSGYLLQARRSAGSLDTRWHQHGATLPIQLARHTHRCLVQMTAFPMSHNHNWCSSSVYLSILPSAAWALELTADSRVAHVVECTS